MRITLRILLPVLVCGFAASESAAVEQESDTSSTPQSGLQIEIQSPSVDFRAVEG